MINLLPPDYKEDLLFGRRNKRLLNWSVALVFGVFALFVTSFLGKMTIDSAKNQAVAQKNSIQEQIDQSKLSDVEKDYSSFVDATNSLKKIYSQEVLYSRLIRKLATLLPPGAKITSISLTDKDKAITLNFNNSKDGLGPVILTNLLNQGELVSEKSRQLATNAFGLQTGLDTIPDKTGLFPAKVSIDTKQKQLTFYIRAEDSDQDKKKVETYSNALKGGGDFAYQLVLPAIQSNFLDKELTASNVPRFTGYKIDSNNRYVDFTFRANSINDVNRYMSIFSDNTYGAFIETYSFENKDLLFARHCKQDKKTESCEVICKDSAPSCDDDQKQCRPLTDKGCEYIIRGYYDELFTNASVSELSNKEKQTCKTAEGKECTHKVTGKFNQLFDSVDINKTSACIADASGTLQCSVDMRAQFSPTSKFYFINSTGATQ